MASLPTRQQPQEKPTDNVGGSVGRVGGEGEVRHLEVSEASTLRRRGRSRARLGLGGSELDGLVMTLDSGPLLEPREFSEPPDLRVIDTLGQRYSDLQKSLENLWMQNEGATHAYVVFKDGRPYLGTKSIFWKFRDSECDVGGWTLFCVACGHIKSPPMDGTLLAGPCLPSHALYENELGQGGMQGSQQMHDTEEVRQDQRMGW